MMTGKLGSPNFMRVMQEPYNVLRWLVLSVFCQSLMLLLPFAQGIKPTGPWFTHHTRRPNETFDFRICFPVEKDVKPTGRVEPGVLEATRVARTVYTGNYAGLGGAWGEFVAWTEANNLKTREDLWERYLLGPESGTPPEEWRTEMNRPMA